jgi:hypothetical protein
MCLETDHCCFMTLPPGVAHSSKSTKSNDIKQSDVWCVVRQLYAIITGIFFLERPCILQVSTTWVNRKIFGTIKDSDKTGNSINCGILNIFHYDFM